MKAALPTSHAALICCPQGLPDTLAALQRNGAGYVFIDTRPHADAALDAVFGVADLVLVPVKPTPDDL